MWKTSISIIMPVYNCEKYICQAVKSILDQTFIHYELIIINDGSTDQTLNALRSFNDKRIKIISNKINKGNYFSRNLGIKKAKGKYICVMDADDYALPNRLEVQYNFMELNSDVGLSGGGFRFMGSNKNIYREINHELIKIKLLKDSCLTHSTFFARHDLIKEKEILYDEYFIYASDYEIQTRIIQYAKIANIPEIILEYRLHNLQISSINQKAQNKFANLVRIKQLANFGIQLDRFEKILYLKLIKGEIINFDKKKWVIIVINKLIKSNKNLNFYNQGILEDFFFSILSFQGLIIPPNRIRLNRTPSIFEKVKANATDLTFIIPIRIDSIERLKNLQTTVSYLTEKFETRIIILEADKTKKVKITTKKNIRYSFTKDCNPIFHRTKYLNILLNIAKTKYVAIWDTDVIIESSQIINSLTVLKEKKTIVSFPYDGRFIDVNKHLSECFRSLLNIEILFYNIAKLNLMFGYHSTGGAIILDRLEYIKMGGENEKIYGWGPDDVARVKQLENSNFDIHRTKGPLFHLWHPRGKNSWYANANIEINNKQELLLTCVAKSFIF